MIQKIQCQSPNPRISPPSVGARIGAAPITRISFDISRAAACPSARSRTIARGITIPAEPPMAPMNRNTDSTVMSVASAQPALAAA